MKLFATVFGPRQSRQRSPQGFAAPSHQTFLLEPILTPSGIIDGVDDAPDVADIPLPDDVIETDIELDIETDVADTAVTDPDIPETELEDVAFITDLSDDLLATPSFQFESGYFTVGDSGEVTIDYLFDGGKYQGELAIFSLEGMEDLEPGSEAFIQEAANRALSDSELGHVVISDRTDGARFSGELGERDWNSGDYRGARTYQMQAGDRFGVMLVPNGRVEAVANNPGVGGTSTPLFSLATANPDDGLQLGQIADVTGDGNTYVFEDMRVGEKADYDYNDLIFQIRGATGETALVDDLIDPDLEWRDSDLGRSLVDYAAMAIVPDEVPEIANQPLVGIIDTGFSGENPDLDYDRIQLGKDWVDGDDNPLLSGGEGNEHGTHVAGLIGATQDNGIGIDGVNDDAPLWFGRAIGSGNWHESLREFVDAAQESEQPNAVVNLSLDLTQVDAEGNVTTRYEFTPQEREAIEYARQNGVLIVAAAGNDGGVMSVLGQAAQEFDNILTVGAADGSERADYSSYGRGLGLLAAGGTTEQGILSLTGDGLGKMAGTSVATAQVTGAVSRVWAANPDLSYRQVIEILQETATDLGLTGWDAETGAGLLNLQAAILVAKATAGQDYGTPAIAATDSWSGAGKVTPTERAANPNDAIAASPGQSTLNQTFRRPYQVRPGDTLATIASRQLHDVTLWSQIQRQDGSPFDAITTVLASGEILYLPVQYTAGTGLPVVSISASPVVEPTGDLSVHLGLGELTLGNLQTQTNFVGSSDPEDFFKFTVATGAKVHAYLTDLEANADLALVRDFNGNKRLDPEDIFIASNEPGTQDEFIERPLAGGAATYFAYVKPTTGDTNYTIKLDVDAGDTITTASSIGILTDKRLVGDYEYSGLISADDPDIYRFRVDETRDFEFGIRDADDADVTVSILDAEGNVVATGQNYAKTALFANQLYFAKVTSNSNQRTDYNLVLNPGRELGKEGFKVDDEDSLGYLEERLERSYTLAPGTADYHRFRVTDDDRNILFALRDFSAENEDISIQILDEDGNVLATEEEEQRADNHPSKLGRAELFEDKLYIVKVASKSIDQPIDYTLVMNPGQIIPKGSDDSSSIARDNVLGIFKEAGDRRVVEGFSTDTTQYHRFRVTKDFKTNIAIEGINSRTALYLLDENGNTIAKEISGDRAVIWNQELEAGKLYFVKVAAMDGEPTNYDIIINPHTKITGTAMQPNPDYIYRDSDYLNALYQDSLANGFSRKVHDGTSAFDSDDSAPDGADADGSLFALVGGEVVEAKNGVESPSKNWRENGTIAIYNSDLNKTFVYWHLDEGSIDESLEGKTISAGDFIGREGNTGRSFGKHTHVEIHEGRLNIDMTATNTGIPENFKRLDVAEVFQEAVRKGLVKLYQ